MKSKILESATQVYDARAGPKKITVIYSDNIFFVSISHFNKRKRQMKFSLNSLIIGSLVISATVQANEIYSIDNAYPNSKAVHFRNHLSIVGSWEATIDFFGTPFRALYSFQRGGTLTESDNPGFDPNFGDNALSPGLGSWKKTSLRSFAAKYRKLAYDVDGQLQEVYTSRMVIRLEKDGSLSGTLSIVVALPDGTVVNELPNLPITAIRISTD